MSAEAETKEREDLVTIEVDGRELRAPKGEMLIRVTDEAGIRIPRFCYHNKLSIAANCRMCLVDVEKAPKPLPACATPVADGMKVYTQSKRAIDAQQGVMEFLLINHPLDCPVCDQGGECELQDLSMGYGRAVSRFTERKRVVPDPNIGSLVSTDMTRCIHCTRCVRFLEEVAGTRELGAVGRGEHMKITTWVERSVDSELSGNIIDLCPVGALNNKPFRFRARSWEMLARTSVSAHDSLGSNLFYHVLRGRVLRAVPKEFEAVNECWMADRDRYSNEGLYAPERLETPMVKRDGEWRETDWETALAAATDGLRAAAGDAPADNLGALAFPGASVEELYLVQKLMRSLGSGNVDCRLRQRDFADQDAFGRQPGLGLAFADLENQDAVLVVGGNVRHDQPLLGHRLRKGWRGHGMAVSLVNPVRWALHFEPHAEIVARPSDMVGRLAAVARAVAESAGREIPESLSGLADGEPGEAERRVAESLVNGERAAVLVGNYGMTHASASALRALAAFIAQATGASLSLMPESANTAGGWAAGCVPHRLPGGGDADPAGRNAGDLLSKPAAGMLLWNFDPVMDTAAGAAHGLGDAGFVVAATSYASDCLREVADVLLPVGALPEGDASLVSCENRWQIITPATRPPGEARQGWRVLRVLGHQLGADGFDFLELDELRREIRELLGDGDERPDYEVPSKVAKVEAPDGLERIAEVPIYAVDAIVRHARPLQESTLARHGWVALNPADAGRLGLEDGDPVRVEQGGAAASLALELSDRVPEGAAWLPAATPSAAALGNVAGTVKIEKEARP